VSVPRAAWMLFLKDMRIELRSGEIVTATALFAALIAILTSLSFYIDPVSSAQLAPGVLWIAVAFSGILAMSRNWNRERDLDALRGLLLSPGPRASIYLAKVLGAMVFLAAVEVVLVVLVQVLFQVKLLEVLGPLSALLGLGTVGFTAAGNLLAPMGSRTLARDLTLAVAYLPLVAPALLCGVVGTRELLDGAAWGEIVAWIRILAAFDLVCLAVGLALFESLSRD
jgi:heme exporter protein B